MVSTLINVRDTTYGKHLKYILVKLQSNIIKY